MAAGSASRAPGSQPIPSLTVHAALPLWTHFSLSPHDAFLPDSYLISIDLPPQITSLVPLTKMDEKLAQRICAVRCARCAYCAYCARCAPRRLREEMLS